MRIDGFNIDGYGVHHDLGATTLPTGLTIVAGPNEAGKTTLQHFLIGMLFGFTASNRGDHHAPLNGGTYGGRLHVTDDHGRALTIHRGARRSSLRITGPDGPLPEAELNDLLGGATRDLYQSIFAVHLDELAQLKAMSDDQVRDRVFSAGILGAGRTAQRALTQLADERDALLKPGGRSPDKYLIKKLRAELVDARSRLAEVRRDARSLPALASRITSVDADRATARTQRTTVASQQTLLTAVAKLWPAWAEAADARSALDQLGKLDPVPDQAGEQLARAVERQQDLSGIHHQAALELASAQAHLDSLESPGPALGHREQISALASGAVVETERLTTIAEHDTRATHVAAELHAALAELGPDCDETWLDRQPEHPDAAAELRRISGHVTETTQQRARLVEQQRRTNADLDDSAAELSTTEANIAASPHHGVERSRNALEHANALVALVTEHDAAARRMGATTSASAGTALPAFVVPTLVALGLLVMVAGGIAIGNGAPIAGGLALATGLALEAISVALHRATRQAGTSRLAAGPDALAAELSEINHELSPVLTALGLDARPSLTEATNLRTRATHLATEAADLERNRAQLTQQRQALDAKIARHQARSAAETEQADRQLHEAKDTWTAWLQRQDLPADFDPATAANVLDSLTRARAHQRTLATARADHHRALAQHQAYIERLQDLLDSTELTVTAEPQSDPLAAVAELDAALTHAIEAQHQQDRSTQATDATRQAHDQAQSRADIAQTELDAVLANLGAATTADAQAIIDQAALASVLRASITRADRDLATAIGTNPGRLDQARTLLGQGDPMRWTEQLAEVARHQRDLDDRIDELTTELAHLGRERQDLEASADVPTAELRVTDLEAQLVSAVTRWAALTVAHQQVEGTLARYQRERQPDVVKHAARRFQQVTGGRYTRLEVRDQDIIAIDATGREVAAADLSQGSVEQLYLCMRFALAESFARTAALPILLDDIIVNADPDRMIRLANTIAEIAVDQQVFMFTCHNDTVEMLQAAAPDARLLTLKPSATTRTIGLSGEPTSRPPRGDDATAPPSPP